MNRAAIRAPVLLLFVVFLSVTQSLHAREPKKTSRHTHNEDQSNFLGKVLFHSVLAPWAVPYFVARNNRQSMAPQPFVEGCGFFCLSDLERTTPAAVVHVDLDGGYELDGLPYGGLGIRVETQMGLGVSTRQLGYWANAESKSGVAVLGKTDMFYRFATTRWVQFRTGLGLRYLVGPITDAVGVDFLYAVDIQWGKPLASTFEFNAGSVGRSGLAEIRGTLDVYVDRFRIYAGWHQAWFLGEQVNGPILGIGGYL